MLASGKTHFLHSKGWLQAVLLELVCQLLAVTLILFCLLISSLCCTVCRCTTLGEEGEIQKGYRKDAKGCSCNAGRDEPLGLDAHRDQVHSTASSCLKQQTCRCSMLIS